MGQAAVAYYYQGDNMRFTLWGVVLLTVASVVACALAVLDGGLQPVTGAARRIPIYCVDTDKPMMALTFNGAWGPDYGKEIVDILTAAGVKSTFFVLDVWLTENGEVARRVVDEGHEIAMHSATHADFTVLGPDQIRAEIRSNCMKIIEVTGKVPRLFRPPSGAYDDQVIEVVGDELGFLVIQWHADSVDWRGLSAEQIVDRITPALTPGSIVLFHTNAEETVKALPQIIKVAEQRGLQMVTVSELLLPTPFIIDHRGCQRRSDQ